MLQTFSCGVSFNVVLAQEDKNIVMNHINRFNDCYEIGIIEETESEIYKRIYDIWSYSDRYYQGTIV